MKPDDQYQNGNPVHGELHIKRKGDADASEGVSPEQFFRDLAKVSKPRRRRTAAKS
jgi:hypothetical protein